MYGRLYTLRFDNLKMSTICLEMSILCLCLKLADALSWLEKVYIEVDIGLIFSCLLAFVIRDFCVLKV